MASTLLRALLQEGPRTEALLGDLEELWRERRLRTGRVRAGAWYVVQAATAGWNYRQGGEAMLDVINGLRATLVRMKRAPMFSLAAVGTLALGVGANGAVLSLVSGVLLDPLPYPEPSRIAFVYEDQDEIGMMPGWATVPNYLDWREQANSFESLALFRGRSVSITTGVIPEYAYGALVTPEFFDVFSTEPTLGRRFTPDDAEPGADPVVILGHGLWTRGFGADPGLVGRTVRIDGEPHTVVGVMPSGFEAHGDWVGTPVQVWRPFPITEDVMGQGRSFHVAGRLAAGVDLDGARAEMTALGQRLAQVRPEENDGWHVHLRRYREMIVEDVAPALWLMLATTLLLLVVACANVASLSVNRVLDRARELATRRALGADRRSVVGAVLGESAVLSVVGGGLGLVLAHGLVRLVKATEPGRIPRLGEVGLDGRVLVLCLAVVTLTALALGAASAAAAVRGAPADLLRGGRGTAPRWGRARTALVAGQLGLSFALLLTAGLLVRSFHGLHSTDLGLDPDDVTAATVALSWNRVALLDDRTRFTGEVLEALRALPGVASAGMINSLPLSGSNASQPVEIDGVSRSGQGPVFAVRGISPGYLETLRIPVVAGRDFGEEDVLRPTTVLVNRAAAERFWPGEDAVGGQVRPLGEDAWRTVVGVVGDVRHYGPERPALPELYIPYSDEYLTSKSFVVRWEGQGRASPDRVRDAIFAVDPEQPVREVRSMAAWAGRATAAPRFQSLTMALAALLATTLAAVGLFGVLAGAVRARTVELAVRMALGAPRRSVLSLVILRAGGLVGAGIVGGTLLALLLGGVLGRFLVGVSAHDPGVIAAAALLFALVAGGTALLPARRATAVDPARVLREE